MLGTVVLHTRLAERQGEIDRLEAAVTDAREQLRRAAPAARRAALADRASPSRPATYGMMPAPRTEFLPVDPQTLAAGARRRPGIVDEVTGTITTEDPLDQIRRVKAADGGAG